MVSLVLLQQDLRLQDHPSLEAAFIKGDPTIILYIYDPKHPNLGAASKWWLHYSLKALGDSLEKEGSSLYLEKGAYEAVLKRLLSLYPIKQVYWNKSREPEARKKEKIVENLLKQKGCQYESFEASYLFPLLVSPKGTPYQVFTPFWKACLKEKEPRKPAVKRIPPPYCQVKQRCFLEDFALLPQKDWADHFSSLWTPGEKGAHNALNVFLKEGISDYEIGRDIPSIKGSSRLSPHLHFGEISPFEVWHKTQGSETYPRELGWREFASSLLYFFPSMRIKPLKAEWSGFQWEKRTDYLEKWKRGLTGYPMVDAGMRELWLTGWMHNRVRMIVGSFLVKDLLIDWKEGESWFWDTLLDADLANNAFGWQWIAGCGADAAPYFRVFNPVLQGRTFDSEGSYVRHYVPELEKLPSKWIHAPWEAPEEVLEKAGIILGKNYPRPVIDHKKARVKALQVYEEFKKKCH